MRRCSRDRLGPVRPWAKTCSPECRLRRKYRLGSELWRKVAKRPVPEPDHGPGWHCSECGVDFDQANRKREKLGLQPLYSTTQVVCSPACYEVRRLRQYAARWGAPPRPLKGRRRDPKTQKWI
jgi:hypothetical protein